MGFLQGLAGNMQQMDEKDARAAYGQWLTDGEQLQSAYRMIRDGFALTDRRIITTDRQGVTGKKVRVFSIALESVVDVTAETAGSGIDDSELTITYITTPRLRAHNSATATYTFEFPKSFDLPALYRYFMTVAERNRTALNAS